MRCGLREAGGRPVACTSLSKPLTAEGVGPPSCRARHAIPAEEKAWGRHTQHKPSCAPAHIPAQVLTSRL